MGSSVLIPLAVVVGMFGLAYLAIRWAIAARETGAKAQQKLDDLAQISGRESGASDQLTKAKPTLDELRARWKRRLERLRTIRKTGGSGGGSNSGA